MSVTINFIWIDSFTGKMRRLALPRCAASIREHGSPQERLNLLSRRIFAIAQLYQSQRDDFISSAVWQRALFNRHWLTGIVKQALFNGHC
jgi:hypothetical protein